MEYNINLYDIEENGRCKADISMDDLNLFIGGFRVVPGTNGKGVIVHMPKGMGTDWKYKEIEWHRVREVITKEYLSKPEIQEILQRQALQKKMELQNIQTDENTEDFQNAHIHLYHFEQETGTCRAGIILPKSKEWLEGFTVKANVNGGVSVYMPKELETLWNYDEISWKDVQKMIVETYRKERCYINSKEIFEQKDPDGFRVQFHSVRKEYKYELLVRIKEKNVDVQGFVFDTGGELKLQVEENCCEQLKEQGIDIEQLKVLCDKAFENDGPVSDKNELICVEIGQCVGRTIHMTADFSLPKNDYVWKNFYMKEREDGTIIVHLPGSLKGKWINAKYPWNVLCEMLKKEFRDYVAKQSKQEKAEKTEEQPEMREEQSVLEMPEEPKNLEIQETKKPISEKKLKEMEMKNQVGRIRNASNTAFLFIPHSILKLVERSSQTLPKNLTQQIVYALNNPQGGIGSFEIEILDWISKLKYVSKTMILDLVLSGYISLGNREKINANKMTDVMNRLYRLDLIELSIFISVDDEGNQPDIGKGTKYRVHTLGRTGYNLLKEMGRHPERRNPFGVLADGNTVKRQLTANQWLVYWLTHYEKQDILDYATSTVIYLIGPKWNGVRIYASINLETVSVIGEPIRRCEDFEKESSVLEIQKKLSRMIEILDNQERLYTAMREQIVFPARPVISYICEDDEHMYEIAGYVRGILEEHPQQEVWFTTDLRMFNYNSCRERFLKFKDGNLEVMDLESTIGVKEMTMEEMGGMSCEL